MLIAVGYALLVAADFVFNTNELRDTVPQNSLAEIPWTVAQAFVAFGLVGHREAVEEHASERTAEAADPAFSAQFLLPLLSVALGTGLSGALVGRLVESPTVALACYVFGSAAIALAMAVIARAHTRALAIAWQNIATLSERGAIPAETPNGLEMLRLFGSKAIVERTRTLLLDLRGRTVPCGHDRLFSLVAAWGTPKPQQVFIAMPFSQPWSAETDLWVREAVVQIGWSAVRADELFETRDVLAGIWKSICESDVMVADLTGRNPNVLYEVGIAHCLGKPVVFTCQQIEDVPFDLATKRIVVYGSTDRDASNAKLRRALLGCSRDASRSA
jgi:hypothetical protein